MMSAAKGAAVTVRGLGKSYGELEAVAAST